MILCYENHQEQELKEMNFKFTKDIPQICILG